MSNKLNLGTEKRFLSKTAIEEIQRMWDMLPNEEADVKAHKEFLKELNEVRQPLGKIVKHLNRIQVIANTQLTKARMREHIDSQISIFDFGTNPTKDQAKNEGE